MVELSSASFVTAQSAPIFTLLTILILPIIIAPVPINTLSPISSATSLPSPVVTL